MKRNYNTYTFIVCDGNAEWHVFKKRCDDEAAPGYIGSAEYTRDSLAEIYGAGCVVTYYRNKDVVETRYI